MHLSWDAQSLPSWLRGPWRKAAKQFGSWDLRFEPDMSFSADVDSA